ncbi:D-3-phosphoglycerate dehydrogenase 1 [Venturia nashicola]|nr:D-3-phosphoglycerate dehydrogenase 1 [Venturia nashicola]
MASTTVDKVSLPRVAITYCTQCKWMLRAAYFGQELLSTFGTTIGEIALIPATGGLFTVTLSYLPQTAGEGGEGETKGKIQPQTVLLWDRKAEGGFPETKVLKQRVRDHLDPGRQLGHSDTASKQLERSVDKEKPKFDPPSLPVITKLNLDGSVCEDCT